MIHQHKVLSRCGHWWTESFAKEQIDAVCGDWAQKRICCNPLCLPRMQHVEYVDCCNGEFRGATMEWVTEEQLDEESYARMVGRPGYTR